MDNPDGRPGIENVGSRDDAAPVPVRDCSYGNALAGRLESWDWGHRRKAVRLQILAANSVGNSLYY